MQIFLNGDDTIVLSRCDRTFRFLSLALTVHWRLSTYLARKLRATSTEYVDLHMLDDVVPFCSGNGR